MRLSKGRPVKPRNIESCPKILQFSPRGRPGRPDEIELNPDHFEAIKLADFKGYSQMAGAEKMGVSRATFGRVLREARFRISDALVSGKIIRIRSQAGHF